MIATFEYLHVLEGGAGRLREVDDGRGLLHPVPVLLEPALLPLAVEQLAAAGRAGAARTVAQAHRSRRRHPQRSTLFIQCKFVPYLLDWNY